MTLLYILLMIGGLLILLSQSSYAYIICSIDFVPVERKVHCVHHTVHAVCGLLTMIIGLAMLAGNHHGVITVTCGLAALLLLSDALSFVILNKTHQFSIRRDAIMHKWKGEKVFGPEHDAEVTVYRALKEITEKNLLRDGLHLALFLVLFFISL